MTLHLRHLHGGMVPDVFSGRIQEATVREVENILVRHNSSPPRSLADGAGLQEDWSPLPPPVSVPPPGQSGLAPHSGLEPLGEGGGETGRPDSEEVAVVFSGGQDEGFLLSSSPQLETARHHQPQQ